MNSKIEKIQSDTPLIGTIITLSNPQITEMLSSAGFDWLMIDMEHSTLTIGEVQSLLQAMHPDCISIVRIPGNDPVWIKRVLETGCDGIMVPLVNSEEEANAAVNAAKYPPDGNRSIGVSRAHGYGAGFDSYIKNANRETVVLIQIEHINSVNNIEQILSVKGIGGIFIGPYDLSGSLNRIGDISNEKVKEAIARVKESCNRHAVSYGYFGMKPEAVQAEIKDGCKFILVGIDFVMLAATAHRYIESLKGLC